MMRAFAVMAVGGLMVSTLLAQEPRLSRREPAKVPAAAVDTEDESIPHDETAEPAPRGKLLVPAGTRVPLVLKNAISTKSARVGDSVYAQTSFPIAVNNRMVIPAGTYVQGRISDVKRAGRLKGRAEVLFHFTSLVFPSGYTVSLPGAVDASGSDTNRIKDKEGTIQHEGEKGKDAATVAKTAGEGAAIGAIASRGVKGAAVGGGLGAATGMAIAMLTRGSDVRLEPGQTVEMTLQRDLLLDEGRVRTTSGFGARPY
jgi:hypothetical protein